MARGLQPPPFEFKLANVAMPEIWKRFFVNIQNQIDSGLAPADAPFLITEADGALTSATNLGVLATGYVKATTALGVAAISTVATIPATDGGTGITSYTIGDLIYANTGTTFAKLLDVATGNALLSGGVATAPAWGKITPSHFSGTLPVVNGGTGSTAFTAGSVVFSNGTILTQDNANLFWDDTNNRLGILTNSPSAALDVNASVVIGHTLNESISVGVTNPPATDSADHIFAGGNGVFTGQNTAAGESDIGNNFYYFGGWKYRFSNPAQKITFSGINLGNIDVCSAPAGVAGAALTWTSRITVQGSSGNVGLSQTVPTATLHLRAGTTAASSAPLKFTSGSLLTTAEAGAVEFLTDAFYGTITTGAARKTFAFLESPVFTSPSISGFTAGSVVFSGASGLLTQDNANLFWDDTNNRLGINTNSPSVPLYVAGSGRIGDADSHSLAVGVAAPSTTNTLRQIFAGGNAVIGGGDAAAGETDIGGSFYYNSGFKYRYAGTAGRITFNGVTTGDWDILTAASGAANAAITWDQRVKISGASGNIKVAGTAVRGTTEGSNHIDIFDGTPPVGTLTNGVSLYSSGGKLFAMDAAGTATQLTP